MCKRLFSKQNSADYLCSNIQLPKKATKHFYVSYSSFSYTVFEDYLSLFYKKKTFCFKISDLNEHFVKFTSNVWVKIVPTHFFLVHCNQSIFLCFSWGFDSIFNRICLKYCFLSYYLTLWSLINVYPYILRKNGYI